MSGTRGLHRVLLTCAPSPAHQAVRNRLLQKQKEGGWDVRVFPAKAAANGGTHMRGESSGRTSADELDRLFGPFRPVLGSPETLEDACRLFSPHAILSHGDSLPGEAINACFEKNEDALKVVCALGAGYNNIDLSACAKHGVAVCNVPEAVTDATADIALFLMLSIFRKAGDAQRYCDSGAWGKTTGMEAFLGQNPRGKTLGIVGLGRIGSNLAQKAHACWDMKILYHSRRRAPPEKEAEAGDAQFVPNLRDMLRECHIVSVHTPLTADTRHLIGAAELEEMGPRGLLVNTSRGEVVDEEALIAALEKGALGGAGLDVTSTEPGVSEDLVKLPNVVVLPHVGSSTVETRAEMYGTALDNLEGFLEEGALRNCVNVNEARVPNRNTV